MLLKINSKYILQEVFSYVIEKIKLKVVKYDSKLSNKLDLTPEDYKMYFCQKKIYIYSFLYSNEYLEIFKKKFYKIIPDNNIIQYCYTLISKKPDFYLSLFDKNYFAICNNPNFINRIAINISNLKKLHIPKKLISDDLNLTQSAYNIITEIYFNKEKYNMSNKKIFELLGFESIKDNEENISLNEFIEICYNSIINNPIFFWNILYELGYNYNFEKTEILNKDYVIDSLGELIENRRVLHKIFYLSNKKIYKMSFIFESDIYFIYYLNKKHIFSSLKELEISLNNLTVLIGKDINFIELEKLSLYIKQKINYNEKNFNIVFPKLRFLNIYIGCNFDLITLINSFSKIEELNIYLLSSGNIRDSKTIPKIIFEKLKILKIEINKESDLLYHELFNDFLNNINIPNLNQYILNINFNKLIENIGNINEINIINDNNFNLINRTLINILKNKDEFSINNIFNLLNNLTKFKYLEINLESFYFVFKTQREKKNFLKLNFNNNDIKNYYNHFDLSINDEIFHYKKIDIKGLNMIEDKIIKDDKYNNIEKIIENEDIQLNDIFMNLNKKKYFVKSLEDIREIYFENEIQFINFFNIEIINKQLEKGFKKLKILNLTIGLIKESPYENNLPENHIFKNISKLIQKSKNLKILKIILNPSNFNKEMIHFLFSLIQNLEKLKVLRILTNSHKYNNNNINIKAILNEFPKIKEKEEYYFNEFKIGQYGYDLKETNENPNFCFFNKIKFSNKPIKDFENHLTNIKNHHIGVITVNLSDNFDITYFKKLISNSTFLDMSNFDTFHFTNFEQFFSESKKLTFLNLSNLNTINIINMNRLFYKCSSLINLDLSSFNTINVTDMSAMFSLCTSLISLNLSNFNTNKVQNMMSMFYQCSSLKDLNLSNFNTSNVMKMNYMFYKCSSLNYLDLSSFNTERVTNIGFMFSDCSSLEKIDLSNSNCKLLNNKSNVFRNTPSNLKCITEDKELLSILNSEKII